MPLSHNPILKAAGFPALPKTMSVPRHAKIGATPTLSIPKANATISIQYYDYLRRNSSVRTPLFEEVYKTFYLRNTHLKGWTSADYSNYFSYMFSFAPTGPYENDVDLVAKHLQGVLTKGSYELSFSSKLVHTKDNSCPIFDNMVIKYLKEFEGLILSTTASHIAKYKALCNWYDNFIKRDPRYKSWIGWFDITFPSYIGIDPVKKIDFILFFGA